MANKGSFQVAMKIDQFLEEVETAFTVLPITARACARTRELSADYPRDPADRIIAATALVEGLTLLAAYHDIIKSRAVPVVW